MKRWESIFNAPPARTWIKSSAGLVETSKKRCWIQEVLSFSCFFSGHIFLLNARFFQTQNFFISPWLPLHSNGRSAPLRFYFVMFCLSHPFAIHFRPSYYSGTPGLCASPTSSSTYTQYEISQQVIVLAVTLLTVFRFRSLHIYLHKSVTKQSIMLTTYSIFACWTFSAILNTSTEPRTETQVNFASAHGDGFTFGREVHLSCTAVLVVGKLWYVLHSGKSPVENL